MKTKLLSSVCFILLYSSFILCAGAQGTAFTYQGRLNENGSPAGGSYDLRSTLYNASGGGSPIAGPITNASTTVSNGLFTVALDFGVAAFPGADRWVEIAVRTNGSGAFVALNPRQKLTPAPYAIMANSASNLLGTLPAGQLSGSVLNGQLANNSLGVLAGTGLSGGGTVALGGSTTLNNAGVLSITGNADITVSPASGAVTLSDTATNANTPNRLVKRDEHGDFSAGTITLDHNLNLPATTSTSGIIYSDGQTLLHEYGIGNFFAGVNAGNLTLSGSVNTGVGTYALGNATSGAGNTACGYGALYFNTSGPQNTASGSYALYSNTNGTHNTANGYATLYSNLSGDDNTATGYEALFNNTNGLRNCANGATALFNNRSGSDNTALGNGALYLNTIGDLNTASGSGALSFNSIGNYNTASGGGALYNNTSGNYNTAIGANALYHSATNDGNTVLGHGALSALVTGENNIALGPNAGYLLESGSNNIYIGTGGANNENQTIRIGSSGFHRTFIAGAPTYMPDIYNHFAGPNPLDVQVGSDGKLGTSGSSARFKQNIQDMDDASDVLLSLRPVTFQYKPDLDSTGIPQFGLVAEEVNRIDPDLVVRDRQGEIYTVRYQAVNAMLLNEFLKQHRKVEQQSAEIQELKQSVAELKRLVGKLARENN
jgi:hypothetical protein